MGHVPPEPVPAEHPPSAHRILANNDAGKLYSKRKPETSYGTIFTDDWPWYYWWAVSWVFVSGIIIACYTLHIQFNW